MTRYTFRLPDIGEGIAEAEIVAWHVSVGDRVQEDQQVADLMTDKATVEMESPVAGKIIELAGDVGDQVAIGSALMVIEIDGDEAPGNDASQSTQGSVEARGGSDEQNPLEAVGAAEPPSPGSSGDDGNYARNDGVQVPGGAVPDLPSEAAGPVNAASKVFASPAVRHRAKELGVELAEIRTDGDRVRHADLDAFLRYGAQKGYHPPNVSRTRADETVRVIGMRRRIADNMAASKRHIPHFTYVEEINVTKLEAVRADLNRGRGDKPKLTMLPLLIVAICKALPAFPMINARYDDEAGVVTRHGSVHLGMATQTDAGLMVPVIRDAQDRNIWQLATEMKRLAEAARNGKAKSEELSGSTLTVTSLGPLGGIATTPVINRPEVAIIGPNRVIERPIFQDGNIVAAKLMNLSISCDHRVVDGWDAASYVQAIRALLETPVLLFAD